MSATPTMSAIKAVTVPCECCSNKAFCKYNRTCEHRITEINEDIAKFNSLLTEGLSTSKGIFTYNMSTDAEIEITVQCSYFNEQESASGPDQAPQE